MNNCCYLQSLCNRYGDFKIAISSKDKEGNLRWSKHRSVMECWESGDFLFLENANHRAILPTEIVLDMDEKPTLIKVRKICDDFQLKKTYIKAYFTGSRGYHIHIFYNGFVKHSKKVRDSIRIRFCERYNCDLQKIEGSMIAVENMPHWKTGNKKEILEI